MGSHAKRSKSEIEALSKGALTVSVEDGVYRDKIQRKLKNMSKKSALPLMPSGFQMGYRSGKPPKIS